MFFAASINCIDGRVQSPITEFIKNNGKVDYVDVITVPGCDKLLAERGDDFALDLIKRSVEISVAKHGSRCVYISGHDDCAANPADKETHLAQIRKAVRLISSWNPAVRVIGLWVEETWQVEEITELSDVS
ncbi:MAG: hypothetical protein JSV98_09480 [candidate division WOR-3 bacterium]|nr:MAG: hypothetical protein JSV98_09480 [candidate division WOR-3 bacterium]